ncbi:MAG: cob(I)yrinic acid a,c-diamide adenosyltransferase [Rhodocyclales bacterium]|nr:cob(I)yrinic acid a,c-diamide adenosyltransferase [Rhodocyclales bacterium]
MGHRLSRITTRTGDDGSTGLGDGSRVAKSSRRIAALGEVDELNAVLGLLASETVDDDLRAVLAEIQHALFDLGGELCLPGAAVLGEAQVARLEALVEAYNADLPPLKEFILPGGCRAAALAHLARTVCRRAERSVVALAQDEALHAAPRRYLNRLSDLLFVLARVYNRRAGVPDELWRREGKTPRPAAADTTP